MTTLFPLQDMPGSVEALLRASVTAIKKPGSTLPDKGYTLAGISIDAKQFKSFCEMFGFKTDTVPSTYWHVRLFGVRTLLTAHPDAPFPMPGMVHLSDQINQFDTIYPDDKLDVECRFGRLLSHDKGTAFETLTTLKRDGKVVWEEITVNLYMGKKGLGESPVSNPSIDINQATFKESWQLPDTLGLKYARMSGDYNPIHLHPMGGKLFGFPRHLIHGWYGLNRTLAPHQHKLAQPHEIYVSFKKPLLLPGVVIASAQQEGKTMLFEAAHATEGFPHLKGYLKEL